MRGIGTSSTRATVRVAGGGWIRLSDIPATVWPRSA